MILLHWYCRSHFSPDLIVINGESATTEKRHNNEGVEHDLEMEKLWTWDVEKPMLMRRDEERWPPVDETSNRRHFGRRNWAQRGDELELSDFTPRWRINHKLLHHSTNCLDSYFVLFSRIIVHQRRNLGRTMVEFVNLLLSELSEKKSIRFFVKNLNVF